MRHHQLGALAGPDRRVRRDGIDHLPVVGEVSPQERADGVGGRREIDVDDVVPVIDEVLHDHAAKLAAASGDDDAVLGHAGPS